MSVPPEILARMTQGAQGGAGAQPSAMGSMAGAPGATSPGGEPGGGGPAASPMSQPQEKKGKQAAALVNLQIAQNMLEQALTVFKPGEEHYKIVLDVLTKLSKIAGKSEVGDLVPAQIQRLVGQLPQAGGGTDMQKMIRQKMMQGQQQPQPGQQPQPQPMAA